MIQKLHRLKNKRGYTMLEMIIVIAILAIMAGTITANTSTRQNRIREALSTATDFYTVIQTEFTRFQMFDGPLTMSLQEKYAENPYNCIGDANRKYGGMMWYPRAGGNYPMKNNSAQMQQSGVRSDALYWRNSALPIPAGITVEVHVKNNKILSVDWDYSTGGLFDKQPDEAGLTDEDAIKEKRSELSAVLQMELDRKMEYKDGYYYARVIYTNDAVTDPHGANWNAELASSASIRASAVTVLWAAYCRGQLTTANETYTFRRAYTSKAGEIVGVVGGEDKNTGAFLGDTGTNFIDVKDDSL